MTRKEPISVGISNKRIHTVNTANITLKEIAVSKQAKTLTAIELRRVLDYVATRKHAARNRACLLLMYYAGLRVGEAASLRIADVVGQDGNIKKEIQLKPSQTKGGHARTVFVSERLQKELEIYVCTLSHVKPNDKLIYSQKITSDGFTANTLTQHFHYLFKRAGIDGATSHSPRRTFITNLAAKGISVRVLMSLAGHRNISTTQSYIDVNDDMKRSAVELV